MDWRTQSRLIIIASGILLICTAVFTLAGIIAVPWVSGPGYGREDLVHRVPVEKEYGLFRQCYRELGRHGDWICFKLGTVHSWWEACQAMGILAALSILSALILAPFYYCNIWSGCPLKRDVMTIIMIVLCALTAGFLIICMAVYHDNIYHDKLGAAFGMAILATILALIAMIFFIVIKAKNVRYS